MKASLLGNNPLSITNAGMAQLLKDKQQAADPNQNVDPTTVLSNTGAMDDSYIRQHLSQPPIEDVLLSQTLWPETQKLYGHAFEVFCLAASHKGDMAASACKAKSEKYADIIIWHIVTGQSADGKYQQSVPASRLSGHEHLTVVQMEFSKCDSVLLAVTRDRQILLFKRREDTFEFDLLKKVKDAHSRVVWAASWSHDDALFATSSRENKRSVKVWNGLKQSEEIGTPHSELVLEKVPNATSVQFFPQKICEGATYGLVVGQDSGALTMWAKMKEGWQQFYAFPDYLAHGLTVRRIKFGAFRAVEDEETEYTVATCGNDHTVRTFAITI